MRLQTFATKKYDTKLAAVIRARLLDLEARVRGQVAELRVFAVAND